VLVAWCVVVVVGGGVGGVVCGVCSAAKLADVLVVSFTG